MPTAWGWSIINFSASCNSFQFSLAVSLEFSFNSPREGWSQTFGSTRVAGLLHMDDADDDDDEDDDDDDNDEDDD
eukprot:6667175-Karenia_brevis.AAC.1